MHRHHCLLHANCQGEELEGLLLASSAFSRRYRLVRRTNYTREAIVEEELAHCDLFLYQQLGERWGELSSASLLARLPASALALRIPNLLFTGCWPFWTSDSPIDFGDSLLDRLIDEGVPKAVILRIYLHGNIQSLIDLPGAFEASLAREREKERHSCVRTVDYLLERWRKRPMFHTVNHPGREMLVHVANGILEAANLPGLLESELLPLFRSGFPSYGDFDLPIHPQVAAFHGLDYGGARSSYAVFGRRLGFTEYVSRYIDCRKNGLEKEFLAYLHLV